MLPLHEWYVKIRNLTRKSSKKIPAGQLQALKLEGIALRAMGLDIRLSSAPDEEEAVLRPSMPTTPSAPTPTAEPEDAPKPKLFGGDL
jgi:hypothetical protein